MATITNNIEINKLQTLLKYTFTIVPIVAGLDKFSNILVQWDTYLAPSTLDIIPFSGATFMMIVGVIEIFAGILVFTKTQLGAYIVSLWLILIGLSLLLTWHHPDVAVRDIVMAISAFILARLSTFKS
ncbi:hypothetical protein [Aequorivita xiaoshiensis]|uniref:tRNA (5-methylaminomethyl-2-thiouridylate)-methyltransferase n=1 Tax=Aequorivita xiaoshiensis TaxID=2874476 RepID=A0A9X1R2P9_9FLAO|nr:hypothetical protein [Aequorivita xiaoshiensis]MCG2431194.1 hypothetical protein [Aequorivita xiaoshiensis]